MTGAGSSWSSGCIARSGLIVGIIALPVGLATTLIQPAKNDAVGLGILFVAAVGLILWSVIELVGWLRRRRNGEARLAYSSVAMDLLPSLCGVPGAENLGIEINAAPQDGEFHGCLTDRQQVSQLVAAIEIKLVGSKPLPEWLILDAATKFAGADVPGLIVSDGYVDDVKVDAVRSSLPQQRIEVVRWRSHYDDVDLAKALRKLLPEIIGRTPPARSY